MMKKKIIVANWKMNHDFYETTSFLRNILKIVFEKKIEHNKKIIIAPSYPFLHISNQIVQGTFINIASQNVCCMEHGAYTGEVSAIMLKSIGIRSVIVGHSERKKYFFEKESIFLKKIKVSIKHNIYVIFCVGETLDDRKKNKHFSVIKNQLYETVFNCTEKEISYLCIAYEPIWAIGTGKNATNEQIQIMHKFIRSLFFKKYGSYVANNIYILYGGSINHTNVKRILYEKDVDGGLIGNSSLKLDNFLKIINS